jgi:hypothetical protein
MYTQDSAKNSHRPARSLRLWWCPDCGAEFSENKGQYYEAICYYEGTAPCHKVDKLRDIPANQCLYCGNKNIEPPSDE